MNKQFALPGILLFLFGGVFGAAGHLLLANESRTSTQEVKPMNTSTARPMAPDKLAEALRKLSDVLASLELRGVQRSQTAQPENTRTELTSHPTSDPSLAQAIKQLSAAIAGMPSGGGGPARTSSNVLANSKWVNRQEAFASDSLFNAHNSEEEGAVDRAEIAHLLKHMFWNYQDMLDVYGRPDQIETNENEMEWCYEVTIRDGVTEYYSFRFHDGLMVDVGYSR